MSGQALKILIRMAAVVILARLVSPHDYRLLAMIMAVIGVADVFRDFGLSSAAGQVTVEGSTRQLILVEHGARLRALMVLIFLCAPLVS